MSGISFILHTLHPTCFLLSVLFYNIARMLPYLIPIGVITAVRPSDDVCKSDGESGALC